MKKELSKAMLCCAGELLILSLVFVSSYINILWLHYIIVGVFGVMVTYSKIKTLANIIKNNNKDYLYQIGFWNLLKGFFALLIIVNIINILLIALFKSLDIAIFMVSPQNLGELIELFGFILTAIMVTYFIFLVIEIILKKEGKNEGI